MQACSHRSGGPSDQGLSRPKSPSAAAHRFAIAAFSRCKATESLQSQLLRTAPGKLAAPGNARFATYAICKERFVALEWRLALACHHRAIWSQTGANKLMAGRPLDIMLSFLGAVSRDGGVQGSPLTST